MLQVTSSSYGAIQFIHGSWLPSLWSTLYFLILCHPPHHPAIAYMVFLLSPFPQCGTSLVPIIFHWPHISQSYFSSTLDFCCYIWAVEQSPQFLINPYHPRTLSCSTSPFTAPNIFFYSSLFSLITIPFLFPNVHVQTHITIRHKVIS